MYTIGVVLLTQVVIPREENRAISSSKLIPPTPITSIMSAGLLRVLEEGEGREGGKEGGGRERGKERGREEGEREGEREGGRERWREEGGKSMQFNTVHVYIQTMSISALNSH